MNRFILILVLTGISTVTYSQKNKVSIFELDQINGLFYQRNTISPFTGTATEEHPNGKKKMAVPIKDGLFQGTIKEWAMDGTLIYEAEYDKGKQHGKETQWYATGQKKVELTYVSGEPDGICTEWHKNGQKKSAGNFIMGKEDGQHLWWFTNGAKDQEVSYKNGETDGVVKNWYENGTLKLESFYKTGAREGTTTKWFENGQKKSVEVFKNDMPDGESTFWTSKGMIHTIRIHKDGMLVKEKNFRSGNINVGNGYVQVYNEPESFFKVPIIGDKVKPVDLKDITYIIDDHLLQLFNIPNQLFIDTINVSEKNKPILEAYVDYEKRILKEREPDFEFDVKKEYFKTDNKLEAVHWYFESPSKYVEGQTSRTVQEEHYVSVLCNKQVLSLYSAVTKSDDPKVIAAMLLKIANEAVLEEAPIDLNEIIAGLRE